MKPLFYFIVICLLLPGVGCNHKANNAEATDENRASNLVFKSALMPELANTDTAYVLYYDKPGDHRNYTQLAIPTTGLQSLIRDVNATVTAGKQQCITDGKIHFYGEGEAVYTVYFSKGDSCRLLSFMVGAEKYFAAMSTATKKSLDSLQRYAGKPRLQVTLTE